MEYILINREGDAKIITDYKTGFENLHTTRASKSL